jgi:hypothetical protein
MASLSSSNTLLRAAGAMLLALSTIDGSFAGSADKLPTEARPSAAEMIARNASARGGLEAWRKVNTMAWVGHIESAKVPGPGLPFLLEQKRPHSTRFELVTQNQRAIRVYDGTTGWTLRPGANGTPEMTKFTPEELNFSRDAQVIEGPLMNDVAAGGVVTFGGVDAVAGRSAFLLEVKMPSGVRHRLWLDAETFLEVKYEREFRDSRDRGKVAVVLYDEYHDFEGLKMPVIIESDADSGGNIRKMVIERVALNPPLDGRAFVLPNVAAARHHGVTVDTREAGGPAQPR